MEKLNKGYPIASTIVTYTIQIGIVLLVLFHDFTSKDTVIVVSLLIAIYGMNMAQTASESIVSGMHFVALANK